MLNFPLMIGSTTKQPTMAKKKKIETISLVFINYGLNYILSIAKNYLKSEYLLHADSVVEKRAMSSPSKPGNAFIR